VSLFTRRVSNPKGLRAYDLFHNQSHLFAALLEDPKGVGIDLLVSTSGESVRCSTSCESDHFFREWRNRLQRKACDVKSVQCLIYAAYEAVTLLEDKVPAPKSQSTSPYLMLHYPEWSLVFHTEKKEIDLCTTSSEDVLDFLENLVHRTKPAVESVALSYPQNVMETSANCYQHAVEKARNYIHAGDVFQSNIARFWQVPFSQKYLLKLYASLRKNNPAPFSCYVKLPNINVLSASPERLFSLSNDCVVQARPIAGTRQRGEGEDDQLLSAELLLSEKERAEHIMMVDLERNDLGRVCEPGSIEVNECMVIERYTTVQHIVSNIRAKLRTDQDVVDLFRTMFPGGTITGCPKIRCMQIIHELESQARGAYTGGVGYIAWDGSADMNILIRTFWHEDNTLHWAAGAGIVADSDPVMETTETEHKVAGLMRAFT